MRLCTRELNSNNSNIKGMKTVKLDISTFILLNVSIKVKDAIHNEVGIVFQCFDQHSLTIRRVSINQCTLNKCLWSPLCSMSERCLKGPNKHCVKHRNLTNFLVLKLGEITVFNVVKLTARRAVSLRNSTEFSWFCLGNYWDTYWDLGGKGQPCLNNRKTSDCREWLLGKVLGNNERIVAKGSFV